jgi:hypothetical protein
MLLKSWRWLEYDAVALVVLIASLAAVAFLRLSPRRHENRIGRRDHDHIVEADHGGEYRVFRADQAVARIGQDGGALDSVAGAIVTQWISSARGRKAQAQAARNRGRASRLRSMPSRLRP